MQAYNIYIYI